MKIEYSKGADALYVYFKQAEVARSNARNVKTRVFFM